MKSEIQKKIEESEYRKYLSKFDKHTGLWKLDDANWVKNRNETWEAIKERELKEYPKTPKSEIGQKERFYLRAKPRKTDRELYVYQRITLSPFEGVEDIREIFFNEHVSQRRNLHEQLLTYASRMYRAVPNEFHRVELISEALYCSEFLAMKEEMGYDKRLDFVVTRPRDFIIKFAWEATQFLKISKLDNIHDLKSRNNQHWSGNERSYVEVSIEYFLGNLEYLIRNANGSKSDSINELAINGIKELCSEIENYSPDFDAHNRDAFVESARTKILGHDLISDIRES